MHSTLRLVFTSILLTEISLGIIFNMFIVIATSTEWRRRRQLHPSDQILLCLSSSRLCLLLMIGAANFFLTFIPDLGYHANVYFMMTRLFFIYISIWFGTVLSVFYCVKIAVYNHPLFLYVKMRISKLVPWFIYGSFLASLSSSLPIGWCFFTKYSLDPTNVTSPGVSIIPNFRNFFLIFNVSSSPPLLLCCVSVVLLIRYLSVHTRVMQESGSFQSPNLQSHFRVLRSMTCFLFLYVAYYIIVNMTTTGVVSQDSPWIVLCSVLTSATPVLHSAILIYNISKLRQPFQRLFCLPRKFRQEVESLNQLSRTPRLESSGDGD